MPPGTGLALDLPGLGGPIAGRVLRAGAGRVALCFRQDPATEAAAGRAVETLGGTAARQAG